MLLQACSGLLALKGPGYEPINMMMQRTANENAACERRICKRSDQSKIDRIANNDARLILRKVNGATTL